MKKFFALPARAGTSAARWLALRSVWPLRVAALWRLQRCSSTDAAATASDGATPGHWLLLKEPHSGRQHWLQLVWPADARPAHGRISVLSPLGQALLGQLPGATIQLRVLGVQFQFQLQDMLLVRRKPRSQSR
ncbi:MAG: hypothetical protein E6Q75_13810 [Rheinheimera sp.]|nr:MAG: hypothetical protein E6Q75_13810 [Rheinheimera sp.]